MLRKGGALYGDVEVEFFKLTRIYFEMWPIFSDIYLIYALPLVFAPHFWASCLCQGTFLFVVMLTKWNF